MPLDLDDRSRASGSDGTDDGAAAASHSIPNESTLNESSLTYRAFASLEDADACVALQGEIWGTEFDRVPASVLRVAAKIGGLTIGAFDAAGALVGFVFSLTGFIALVIETMAHLPAAPPVHVWTGS